ncbi:hypothetical protein KR222_007225, partial [Zaprionus bogoriensis]
ALNSLPWTAAPLKQCNPNDNACSAIQVQTIITEIYRKGLPELQVPAADPISLGDIRINSGAAQQSFQFNLLLSDTTMHKFGEMAKVRSAKGFTKDLSKPLKLSWDVRAAELEFRAHYDVNGKILILPIAGQGELVLTLRNAQLKSEVVAQPEKRADGHTYLKIMDYKTNVIIGSGYLNMTNLFNNNEELSRSTLKVLNDEWTTMEQAIRPNIMSAIERKFRAILQTILDTIPFENGSIFSK